MSDSKIAVIGLGYVGLPLAISLGKVFETIAFDINEGRIKSLKGHSDLNGDMTEADFSLSKTLHFTSSVEDLKAASFFIIAVPTPVEVSNKPDLAYLFSACQTVGHAMSKGALVVFESTVYPGASEEDCVPVLESSSGLKWKKDFNIGYSPERINPGDKVHTLENIVKVVAADSPDALQRVSAVYGSIIKAGIFKASSIKVAEAAKVIENTQRDLNIALINELSLIFNLMNISTYEVLEAAATKWNFLPFKPGLVGGHCIGVDPYYLTYKAEKLGYHPEVILAGRRINDGMGKYIAKEIIRSLLKRSGQGSYRVNVLGLTFKENVSDIRNSKVVDLIQELQSFGVQVEIADPLAVVSEVEHEYGLHLTSLEKMTPAHCLVLAVSHHAYLHMDERRFKNLLIQDGSFFDLKAAYKNSPLIETFTYWTL
jgi:UDP-N-acetyl-D-glucosamine/UDP-N-acetyl-D-galactosamine dehydrogenase